MAKKTTKKTKSIEETLWDSANKLRGTVESSEYKHVVLGLIFLKFASDKFQKRRQELIDDGKEKFVEMVEFYAQNNVFYLTEESRWSYIIANAKQDDIALKIDTALYTVEKNNPSLKGALPDNYFSRLNMDISKLAALLDTINNIDTLKDQQQDIVGRVYEYFLSKFAIAEGKGKGEFYTPKSIVNLIAMANPPFNQKAWRATDELLDDPRWRGYDVPQTGNANYGWILNMVSKLSDNGVAGFILANGALSGGGTEYEIRKKLIENKLVEAILVLPQKMFYTTDISVTLWILNNNKKERIVTINGVEKKYRNREDETLFIDLRKVGIPFEKKYIQFSGDEINKISSTYHNWQQTSFEDNYEDIGEFCKSVNIEEIRKKDYSLVPSKYIEFVNRDENINFDDKMKSLQSDFSDLLKEEAQSKAELLSVFKNLGYEIEL